MFGEDRLLYTEELNAALSGTYEGAATEVVVIDCHGAGKGWIFKSLIPDRLDRRCEFVVQNEWTEYTAFLEQGCDAALFVAMHAMAGTANGVLSHTVRGTQWRNLRFNGNLVGETGINAALCGTWGCPVLLVTGDAATCHEARALLGPGLKTVEVKEGFGRFSARHITPAEARARITGAAREALQQTDPVAPYDPGRPCEIEVELAAPELAEPFRHRPGIEVLDARRIVSRADSWWPAWKQMYF